MADNYWISGGSAPILILQGLEDQVAVPANALALKKALGDRVELVEVPSADYEMLYEKPQEMLKASVRFLRKQS
tara:strand:+ start:2078 stop:2299 length:222 start_codon:yes stop_codon:yes gene_type:complete